MKNRKEKNTLSQRGFTLIEVMIALAVFAVGLLAVAGMQVIAIKSNTVNRDITEASTVGLDKLEFLKMLPSDAEDLDDTVMEKNEDDEWEEKDAAHSDEVGKYAIAWNVTDDTNTDTKTIDLNVTWKSGHRQEEKRIDLSTIITDK